MTGLFGGGGQNIPFGAGGSGLGGTVYQPAAQGQMDANFQRLLSEMMKSDFGALSRYMPAIMGAGTESLGAAERAGAYESAMLRPELAQARMVSGMAPQFMGQASAWLDPAQTSPIYRQMAGQATQGAEAANAASGVYGPYAAGGVNDALRQLQLGWSAQAPQVAAGLAGSGQNAASMGQNLGTGALSSYLNLVGKPEQTALSGIFGNLGSAFQLPQQTLQDILPYLNLGQAASGLSGELGNLGFQQQQQQLQNLGGLGMGLLGGGALGQLLYGGGGGAFGSGGGLLPFLGSLFQGGAGAGAAVGLP